MPPPAPPPPLPAAAAGRLSVLLTEDNEDAAATLADLLRMLGHSVRIAGTARAAVEAAARELPDVLVCDVGLPDGSGYDVVRAVRAAPGGEGVVALALTGYAQPQDREEALRAGFDAHLAKPPDLDRLLRFLEEAARRREGE